MMLRFFYSTLLLLVVAPTCVGQTLDPYRRINDPMAICDLSGADSSPCQFAYKTSSDSIQAEATGAGIIRSFWMVFVGGVNPDTDRMELWVDDSLLYGGPINGFFTQSNGLICAPFDTASSGAEVCETQIPFHKSFVWTYYGEWHWSGAAWQPIDTTKATLPYLNSPELVANQTEANYNYWNRPNLATDPSIDVDQAIPAGDTVTLTELSGPAYLSRIRFTDSMSDSSLNRLWINIYWDNDPQPSISMPIAELFGIASGKNPLHGFFLSADTSQGIYDLLFPMPFRVHAKITVSNPGSMTEHLQGSISYRDTSWNPAWGYFSAQYHSTTAIPFHVLQPVLHTKGVGRYVGAILNFPNPPTFPSFLEGDGYFMDDSVPYDVPSSSTHYGGMEDYCDGGWYFFSPHDTLLSLVPFSLPFRGCPIWANTIYRFHVNAPYNYSHSMDIDFGHGFDDDYTTLFQSVGFYYQQWTPFYCSSDTITAGNTWDITGTGYAADTAITAMLDSDTIYRGHAQSDGTINLAVPITSSWGIGNHQLSINGITKPEWITVLSAPKIVYLTDSAQPVFSEGDSIDIRAYGFHANESLTLLLGDTTFDNPSHRSADSDGALKLHVFLPWVPEGQHYLNIRRADGTIVQSDSSLFVTRLLDYEFEWLPMPGGGGNYSYIAGVYNWHWSEGAIEFCYGTKTTGQSFSFQFNVPFSDTFSTMLYGVTSNRYGVYRTFIDSVDLGVHDWFRDLTENIIARDSITLSSIYISSGLHTIRFVNEGWDDSAVESSFGPDNFTLRPLSPDTKAAVSSPTLDISQLAIFPNPAEASLLFISGISDSIGTVPIQCFDEIGETVLQTVLPSQIGLRSLDISSLQNGSYWLSLELPSGMKFLHLNVLK